jgi:hypothetical protein
MKINKAMLVRTTQKRVEDVHYSNGSRSFAEELQRRLEDDLSLHRAAIDLIDRKRDEIRGRVQR